MELLSARKNTSLKLNACRFLCIESFIKNYVRVCDIINRLVIRTKENVIYTQLNVNMVAVIITMKYLTNEAKGIL